MKPKLIIVIAALAALGLAACERDYDPGEKWRGKYRPQVVVNSIICPDSAIRITCVWSRRDDDRSDYKPVRGISGQVMEDGVAVATFAGADSLIETGYFPHAGKKYSLRLSVPDYGEVSADTYIPHPPTATARYNGKRTGDWHMTYYHFGLTPITDAGDVRAVWIIASTQMGDDPLEMTKEHYCNSGYVDPLNGVRDDDAVAAKGSNIGYEYYLRIPRANIAPVGAIAFSIWASEYYTKYIPPEEWPKDEEGFPVRPDDEHVYLSNFYVRVIAPSDDFDEYFRDVYRQQIYNYDPDLPLLDEVVYVHNNIRNGLGIFAGYSAATTVIPYEPEPEQ